MDVCQVCGNELEDARLVCPFCGARRPGASAGPVSETCRTVNLEKGMPTANQALQRLKNELAVSGGAPLALVLIHGYGSSGRGGAIKQEVRRYLHFLAGRQQIREMFPGEDIDRRSRRCRGLAQRFPCLRQNLRRPNPGITIVVL